MIEIQAAGPGTPAERSMAACLASLLELGALPAPGEAPRIDVAAGYGDRPRLSAQARMER